MKFINDWMYENAIKCRIRGWVFKKRYDVGDDEGPYRHYGLYSNGRFHKNTYRAEGAMAQENELICEDCGKHIYL